MIEVRIDGRGSFGGLPDAARVVVAIGDTNAMPALGRSVLAPVAFQTEWLHGLAIDDKMIAHVEASVRESLVDDDVPRGTPVLISCLDTLPCRAHGFAAGHDVVTRAAR